MHPVCQLRTCRHWYLQIGLMSGGAEHGLPQAVVLSTGAAGWGCAIHREKVHRWCQPGCPQEGWGLCSGVLSPSSWGHREMWGRRCSWGSLVRIRAEFQWEGKPGAPAVSLGLWELCFLCTNWRSLLFGVGTALLCEE